MKNDLKEKLGVSKGFSLKKNSRYDEIISLGYNCETSFMIDNYRNELNSYVYNWAFINDRKKFIDSLNNLDKILSEKITLLPWRMFKCEKYNINFHPAKTLEGKLFNADGSTNDENIEFAIVELKSRVQYLAKKLSNLFKSNKNTLFIIKIKGNNVENDLAYIKDLYETIKHLHISGKFTLCCIFEEKSFSSKISKLESDNLKIRKVNFFSNEATAIKNSDNNGWNKIFQEFFTVER